MPRSGFNGVDFEDNITLSDFTQRDSKEQRNFYMSQNLEHCSAMILTISATLQVHM